MNTKGTSLILVLLALAGCGGTGLNELAGAGGAGATLLNGTTISPTPNAGTPSAGNTASTEDSAQFLMDAYQDGLGEIQISQLALQKASNSNVTSFAKAMVSHHTALNDNIKQLAQNKGISLPDSPSSDQKALADKLQGLSGDAFDRAYMSANVEGHEKDVLATMQQARQGTDTDVKMLAQSSLPLLKLHLTAAEAINGVLDPSAYLMTAYRDGLQEIQAAQMAQQKATSADVKQFAQQMIDDHTQANNRISTLAQQKGVNLPSSLSSVQQAEAEELAQFSGADFDKAYMDQNVVGHAAAVSATWLQSSQGPDSDVKSLARQLLPTLTSHLSRAVSIDNNLTASFLYQSYQDGNAEILLSELALRRASDNQVKDFAQQMITDHTTLNRQIIQLAQQKGVVLPTTLSARDLTALLTLFNKSGAGFDKLYMTINVQSHQKAVDEATAQSQNATDPQIQSLAQNALPVLTDHLNKAKQISAQLVTTGG